MATYPLAGPNGSQISAGIQWHLSREHTYAIDLSSTQGKGPGGNLIAVSNGTFHLFSAGSPCGSEPASDEWFGPHGFYIISSDNKWVYIYGHAYSVSKADGDTVNDGDIVGVEGSLGKSSGTHLHFSVVPKVEFDSGTACNGAQSQDYTTPFLSGAKLPPVVASQLKYPGAGQSTIWVPTGNVIDFLSLIPSRVCYMIDGKVNTHNWIDATPTHNRYVGELTGSITVKEEGRLNKIFILNDKNNILCTLNVEQDVKKGEQAHFNYTFSFQKYLNCGLDLTEDQLSQLMHSCIVLSNQWEDGHTASPFSTQVYNEDLDGEKLKDKDGELAKINQILTGVTGIVKR